MALSQDEQRILAEIERRLATDDPGLASYLATFRRPGPGRVLRSPRARIIGSLFTVLLVAMISLTVYAMIPFRAHMPRQTPPSTAGAPASTAISAATGSQPSATQPAGQQPSAGLSSAARSTASQGSSNASGSATPAGKAQPAKAKATSDAIFPEASP
jgi:hypothetical protein